MAVDRRNAALESSRASCWHADVTGGAVGAFTTLHRAATGRCPRLVQNNLAAEFLGDYNYAAATNDYGAAVWNDVRQAADCPAIDESRQEFVEAVQAGLEQPEDEEVAEIRGRGEVEPNQGEEGAPPRTRRRNSELRLR